MDSMVPHVDTLVKKLSNCMQIFVCEVLPDGAWLFASLGTVLDGAVIPRLFVFVKLYVLLLFPIVCSVEVLSELTCWS